MKFSGLITVEFVKLPVNTNWNSLSLHGVGWHTFPESTTRVWETSNNVNGLENIQQFPEAALWAQIVSSLWQLCVCFPVGGERQQAPLPAHSELVRVTESQGEKHETAACYWCALSRKLWK